MLTKDRLFRLVAWLTAKHMMHWQAQMKLSAQMGQWFMKQVSPKRWNHAEEVVLQKPWLEELQALSACYDVKRHARLIGGWHELHGDRLDQVANVLVMHYDWDPEDVGEFYAELTEGAFHFGDPFDDDE